LSPDQVHELVDKFNIKVIVQPAGQRKFTNEEYSNAGAVLKENLSECNIVFGVKEVPFDDLIEEKTFMFFSHTIKGQEYNMPLLKQILDKKITLIDYEPVVNEKGKRIIYFGHFAGYAGMIDSLWILGRRLKYEGFSTPLEKIKQAVDYSSLEEAEASIAEVGNEIKDKGLPENLTPLITAFTGRGNVSKGAQIIYDLLPVRKISPSEVKTLVKSGGYSNKVLYSVEFYSSDIYQRTDGGEYERAHFQKHPELYKSNFEDYLPYIAMLINGIYWSPEYDRLVTVDFIRKSFSSGGSIPLRVIGDITCDIRGSIELTLKSTRYDNPCYVFDPETGEINDGWEGKGPVILAVDKLPTELPREATASFGSVLLPFVPSLASADFTLDFESLILPEEIKRAVITHNGKLTNNYEYLLKHLI